MFKPQLSKGSQKILKKKEEPEQAKAVHERLYSAKQGTAQKKVMTSKDGKEEEEPKKEFVPSINKKSQNLKREQNIDEYLVNDAKRRAEMKKQS